MNTQKAVTPPSSGKPKTNQGQVNNFVETFKGQAKSASAGMVSESINQIFGSNKQPTNYQENPQLASQKQMEQMAARERLIRMREHMIRQRQQTTETLVFSHKEESAKQEIEIIKEEIKTLVVQTGKLSSELVQAEKAVGGQIPDIKSGTYYVSFFERIKRLVQLAKKKITESRTWLGEFSGRSKAKSHYWGNVKKSGTKYMLSSERTIATQTG